MIFSFLLIGWCWEGYPPVKVCRNLGLVRVGENFPRMKKESPEKQFELRNGHKLL